MAGQSLYPAELLSQRAQTEGERCFLLFENERIAYRQLNECSNRLANGLDALGIKPNDGVAIMVPNRPEWLYAFFATQKLGAYAVPVNVALKGEGLAYILNHCEARTLIIGSELFPQFEPIRASLSRLEHVIVDLAAPDGSQGPPPSGTIPLAQLMASASPAEVVRPVDPSAISNLMYTSGTTGLPKGVVMRNRAVDLAGPGLFSIPIYRPDDILYTCLPLFHGNALYLTVLRALANGLTVALSRRFSASRFWDEIRHYGATTFNVLGAMIPILLKQPPRPDDGQNPVRLVLSAATPAWAWQEFEKRFNLTVWEGYGAVDGGGFSLMNIGQAPKGSMGKPPPGVEAKVVDDDGVEVAAGEVGNLVFKIDNPETRRVEYFKNPQASEAKVRRGWFSTGDLAYCDSEGNFYFADRKTDSIRRRGENISSFEVEKIINQHPAVLESGAYGVPSELGEDDVMVAVVLRTGQTVAPEELIGFCQERMAKFMLPRYIDFRSSLPKTETHRIQKTELKKQGVTPSTWDRDKHGA
jgi:crotonobetaine/carnitine-CoA ligase